MPSLPTGTVTFLFTDIEGSTRLLEASPEAYRAALARHDAIIRQAVAAELSDSLDAYRRAYVYLNHHGGVMCTEAQPRCDDCPLFKECRYANACGR